MVVTQNSVLIRDADSADVPAITRIYAPYVLSGIASFEEDPPTEQEMLRRMTVLTDGGFIHGRILPTIKPKTKHNWLASAPIFLANLPGAALEGGGVALFFPSHLCGNGVGSEGGQRVETPVQTPFPKPVKQDENCGVKQCHGQNSSPFLNESGC